MLDVAGNSVRSSMDKLHSNIGGVINTNSSTKKQRDLCMGLNNESEIEPFINEYFEMKVNNTKITKGKYCAYDFECEEKKTRYELKSRRIKSTTYPSVFLSTRKIEKGWTEGYRLILLFFFTDGLFYTEYDPFVFKNYTKRLLSVYRDGNREDDFVYEIPIFSLKKLEL